MTYKVTLVERATFLNERSNPVDGYRVTYQLDTGIVDWVELPKAAYNAANVKAAIDAAVKLHETILPK